MSNATHDEETSVAYLLVFPNCLWSEIW